MSRSHDTWRHLSTCPLTAVFFLCTYPKVALLSHEFTSLLSAADVAHQFQYAVRVIGSNYAPTIERDEFLVSEKIKKEREL